MSAPPSEVVDRLERLAAQAPRTGIDADVIWQQGRRRRRGRQGAALAAAVAVGVLATAVTPTLLDRAQPVGTADSRTTMVLPDVVRQPGAWEPAFPSTPGRLSAVGTGTRSSLWSSRNAFWGVSAATGESRFLDLPDAAVDTGGKPALSADGRMLAYAVSGEVGEEPLAAGGLGAEDVAPVVGVAVLDLDTGHRDVWRIESDHGLWVGGMAWAGEVLWWSAGPVRAEGDTAVSARLRVRTWDLGTGEQDEPSGPSRHVGANAVGDAPGGFIEQRTSRRLELVTGGAPPVALRLTIPASAPTSAGTTDAAMSPDGARVAALLTPDASRYDDAPKAVLVGDVRQRELELRPVGDSVAQAILGWSSPTGVVVAAVDTVEEGRPRRANRAWTLDVSTGERTALLEFSGNTPQVAADAWAADVVAAPDAPFAPDPRLVGLGGAVVLAFSVSLWRDVRRRRGHA
jgi:hypothetical protein